MPKHVYVTSAARTLLRGGRPFLIIISLDYAAVIRGEMSVENEENMHDMIM